MLPDYWMHAVQKNNRLAANLIIAVFLKTAEKKILFCLEWRYVVFCYTTYLVKSML